MRKKKKILKIIKYVGIGIFVSMLLCLCIASCKKTNAEEIEIDYRNYNLLVSIEDSNLTSGVFEGHLVVVATITSNQLDFVSIDLSYPDFTCYENDLLNGPYESYGATGIIASNLYFVQSEDDYPSSSYSIIGASEYNTYLQWNNGGMYDAGYGVGVATTEVSDAYSEGVEFGKEQAQKDFTRTLNSALFQKDLTIASLQDDIDYYRGIINSGSTPWGSFKSLLGTIFIYPIKFFKEGFDVDFFGVNLGGLIIGLGLLGISLAIVGAVLGKRASS